LGIYLKIVSKRITSPFRVGVNKLFFQIFKALSVILFFLGLNTHSFSQTLPYPVANSNLDNFLDELATLHITLYNSAIKPYSRKQIAESLKQADEFRSLLNKRQQKELDFYLREIYKELNESNETDHVVKRLKTLRQDQKKRADLFYYKDSLFQFWLNPIGGLQLFGNENGSFYHQWNGAEAFGEIDENWTIFVSFRDNVVSESIMNKSYLTQRRGEDNKGGSGFSDIRGGLYYSWKWGSLGFVKDQMEWGNNQNGSNVLSGRPPTFPMLKLYLKPVKWLEFNYIHGWLNSEVVDSLSIFDFGNGAKRFHYYPKYIAANMYSFKLWKYFTASVGNSMVYSNDNVQPGYLIPFILFKSVEHSIAASNENNAQIFFDMSSRNLKKVHFYGTFFIDEVNFGNFWNDTLHSNWFSYKGGIKTYNFPVDNVSLAFEYTRTNPMVFKHYYPTSTFESNQYNLGHYLRDNSQEFYVALGYKPHHKLRFKTWYAYAEKGPDYPDIRGGGNSVLGKQFMTEVEWKNTSIGFQAEFELFHDAFVVFEYLYQDIWAKDQATMNLYTAPFFQGKTNTYSLRMNFAF
jgi:hypothetical protein